MITQIPNKEQIGAIVNLCVDGLLGFVFNESADDRRKEMHAEHDAMLKIIDEHPVPQIKPYINPREQIMRETAESNDHILQAMTELEKAQSLAKCSVCKKEISETINIVHEKTQEILDASQKVLMMQRLKDANELPPDVHWEDLNKNQKKMVEDLIERSKPVTAADYFREGGEEIGESKRKNPKPRKTQKPKQKPRRK